MNFKLCIVLVVTSLIGIQPCFSQAAEPSEKLATRGKQEYALGRFVDAERDFRELVKRDPSNIYAQMDLGQALFRQEKYAASLVPYEKARELEKSGEKLSLDDHRVLLDQVAMAYGISGNLEKARSLLEDGIRRDPEYPLNYYNLACAFAEQGNKEKALANLDLAFQHKDHSLKGEHMPDPRSDSSFQKYVRDENFVKLMKKIGY